VRRGRRKEKSPEGEKKRGKKGRSLAGIFFYFITSYILTALSKWRLVERRKRGNYRRKGGKGRARAASQPSLSLHPPSHLWEGKNKNRQEKKRRGGRGSRCSPRCPSLTRLLIGERKKYFAKKKKR